jgi:hypothetical protein
MAKKLYDLAVKTGEYKNKEGETKGRWQNVGACMQSDDGGKFLMLAKWFNPAGVQDISGKGGESILLSMFPPRDPGTQQSQAPAQSQAAPSPDRDDEIPF